MESPHPPPLLPRLLQLLLVPEDATMRPLSNHHSNKRRKA